MKELFHSFSAKSTKISFTSQLYTIQIKLLIQVHFSCFMYHILLWFYCLVYLLANTF